MTSTPSGGTGADRLSGRGGRLDNEAGPRDGGAYVAAAENFAAWRAGDPDALERLVRSLTPVLWHLARAYGLDREAAQDVVQSTWLALVRHADSIRDPQAVWHWTTVAARREAWRLSRLRQRENAVEPEVLDAVVPPATGPERAVLADSALRSLWRHVARLPQRCQRLLRIIAFDERPDYASLSIHLGMAVGSIGPTRGRCLDKLRSLMARDPEWADR